MNLRAKFVFSIGLLGLLCLMLPGLLPAQTVVGTSNELGGNCIPFNCAALFGIYTYQQVYSSSAFPGVTPFNQIDFSLNTDFSPTASLDSGSYDIAFSYTSKTVNGLSDSNPSANIGAGETSFGSYTLGGPAPSTLTFIGNTFTYDPTVGNLLMTINISGASDGPFGGAYNADGSGTVTSRAVFDTNSFGSPFADSTGLVTSFDDTVVTPEPSSQLLFCTGLVVLALAARRKHLAPSYLC